MSDQNAPAVNPLDEVSQELENKLSLDELVYDILSARLGSLKKDTKSELEELKNRQKEVQELHDLIAKINSMTEKDGKVKVDDELLEMLNKALKNEENSPEANVNKIEPDNLKILKSGDKYKSEDRQRLIENVRMHIDDLSTDNDMQLQAVTQLTNERYETYQMARAVMKPLDDDKKNKAKAIAGR